MARLALGLDFGTSSVRALLVDVETGAEAGVAVATYAHGESGTILSPSDPYLARQVPADYRESCLEVIRAVLGSDGSHEVVGIGVDTTASTPIPVDARLQPLADDPRHADDPSAHAWLWKDHTAHAEAAEITALAKLQGRPYLSRCGGTYSSEWFWAKLLRAARTAPDMFGAAHSWIELQDYVPAWLCGLDAPVRGVCAAGHKGLWSEDWGGYPSAEFLSALHPELARIGESLDPRCVPCGTSVGGLDPSLAARTGLPPGIPVSVGGIDAHLGAVGVGIAPGTMVKIMGTSTCDILVGPNDRLTIEGVSGIVPGSVLPGKCGIEAGQAAVGDLLDWCARLTGRSHEDLTSLAREVPACSSGLVALDWHNGNRNVLADPTLTGVLAGATLATGPGELYRSLIEATAMGGRKILDRIASAGVSVERIVVCGGALARSPLVMQIYADVFARPMAVAASDHACALGAAICGAVAGAAHPDFASASAAMASPVAREFVPDEVAVGTYDQLYSIYSTLHDEFGVGQLRSTLSALQGLA
ncbi:MAG: ribulokinase [Fimbriimonadaceae bacterium]|nr:ribulokinase [Fimbriimonadaceae bacterium]